MCAVVDDVCVIMCVVDNLVKVDILVLRPSPLPVFDCLQYVKTEGKALGFPTSSSQETSSISNGSEA